MKREDVVNKMVACFNECKKMDYSDQQAMDRVLEVIEESIEDTEALQNNKNDLLNHIRTWL